MDRLSDSSLAAFPARWVTDMDGTLRDAFKAHATPHTFFISNGRIQAKRLGADIDRVLELVGVTTSLAPTPSEA